MKGQSGVVNFKLSNGRMLDAVNSITQRDTASLNFFTMAKSDVTFNFCCVGPHEICASPDHLMRVRGRKERKSHFILPLLFSFSFSPAPSAPVTQTRNRRNEKAKAGAFAVENGQ